MIIFSIFLCLLAIGSLATKNSPRGDLDTATADNPTTSTNLLPSYSQPIPSPVKNASSSKTCHANPKGSNSTTLISSASSSPTPNIPTEIIYPSNSKTDTSNLPHPSASSSSPPCNHPSARAAAPAVSTVVEIHYTTITVNNSRSPSSSFSSSSSPSSAPSSPSPNTQAAPPSRISTATTSSKNNNNDNDNNVIYPGATTLGLDADKKHSSHADGKSRGRRRGKEVRFSVWAVGFFVAVLLG